MAPLFYGFFPVPFSTINIPSLPYDFLSIFLSLAYFLVQIRYVIRVTYKIQDDQLFMLPVRLLVNSRLLAVKFLESQKLYLDFDGSWGVVAPTPVWSMGQLYMLKSNDLSMTQ